MFGIKEMLEAEYKRGLEAGIQHQKNEQLEDANRRQEYLFDEGKRTGYDRGATDGFAKGYKVGHGDGVIEGKYGGIEEIDLDDLVGEMPETGTIRVKRDEVITDKIEVTRCKECEYSRYYEDGKWTCTMFVPIRVVDENDFCSWAMRAEK